jgi:hypothetical protein
MGSVVYPENHILIGVIRNCRPSCQNLNDKVRDRIVPVSNYLVMEVWSRKRSLAPVGIEPRPSNPQSVPIPTELRISFINNVT